MTEEGATTVDTRIGQIVSGRYRISRLLGRGGMGVVYEARHEVVGRRFALKFLHAELAGRPEVLVRFECEARATGALENENIAAVTDFGRAEDGAPYIVMEFLHGEDLGRLLSRVGPLPVPRAVHAVIQACRGLEAAHAEGIIHRDLKPENLYVIKRGDGTDLIKILDFGIAKLLPESGLNAGTRTGTTMGTPSYMSREQARGQKDIDRRTDIYALGVILYELLSGRRPYDGDGYNAILYQVLTREPIALDTLRPNLPVGLAAVVHKAMAPEPNERFQLAADFLAALAPFMGHAVAAGETTATFQSALPTGTAFEAARVTTRAPSGRRPLVLGLVVATVLGIGVAVASGRRHETETPPQARPGEIPRTNAVARAEVPAPSVATLVPAPPASDERSMGGPSDPQPAVSQAMLRPSRPSSAASSAKKPLGSAPPASRQADLYAP